MWDWVRKNSAEIALTCLVITIAAIVVIVNPVSPDVSNIALVASGIAGLLTVVTGSTYLERRLTSAELVENIKLKKSQESITLEEKVQNQMKTADVTDKELREYIYKVNKHEAALNKQGSELDAIKKRQENIDEKIDSNNLIHARQIASLSAHNKNLRRENNDTAGLIVNGIFQSQQNINVRRREAANEPTHNESISNRTGLHHQN